MKLGTQAPAPTPGSEALRRGRVSPLRRLYDWVQHWADTPYGTPALFIIAFTGSIFFPAPPDILLMALAMSKPRRALFYAAVTAIGSVLGGITGYFIGRFVWHGVADFFFRYVFARETFDTVTRLYSDNAFWTVFTAGFTPIPDKVFTIAGGVAAIPFGEFVLAYALSRSLRFFLVAGLIQLFGPAVKEKIERYFDVLSLLFVVLLVGGFLVLPMFTRGR